MKQQRSTAATGYTLLIAMVFTLTARQPAFADRQPMNESELDGTTAVGTNTEVLENPNSFSLSDDIQRRRSMADPGPRIQRATGQISSGAFNRAPLHRSTNIIHQIR